MIPEVFGCSCGDLCVDSCGFSRCVPAVSSSVPVVTDGSVSASSLGVLVEVSVAASDCEFVKSQSFSFSRKRRAFHMESQGDTNAASSPEDVQPLSRRRSQEVDCGVDKKWAGIYQSAARRMLSYLDHSDLFKVNTRELEHRSHLTNRESTMSTW